MLVLIASKKYGENSEVFTRGNTGQYVSVGFHRRKYGGSTIVY